MIDAKKLQKYIEEHKHLLQPVNHNFSMRMHSEGLEKFERRLRMIGFDKCEHVFDAGAGAGQWTLALSGMVKKVTAADINEGRMFLLDGMVKASGLTNVSVDFGSLRQLKYPDASFDGIICYGVIFATGDWKASLAELARVLKPGGRLYLTGNGPGYYRYIWSEQPNKMEGYDPRKWVGIAFYNTWRIEQGFDGIEIPLQIVPPQDMVAEFERLGFENVVWTGEGQYVEPGYTGPTEKPFFKAEYMGDVCCYEVIGKKKA